jgi:hypothetical protein
VRCDPSDDKAFATNTCHLNPQSALVEWDGEHDALLQLDPLHILQDEGPLPTIDDHLSKKPQLPVIIAQVGNLYIEFLRQDGARIRTHATLDPAFRRWLLRHGVLWYAVYRGLSLRRAR